MPLGVPSAFFGQYAARAFARAYAHAGGPTTAAAATPSAAAATPSPRSTPRSVHVLSAQAEALRQRLGASERAGAVAALLAWPLGQRRYLGCQADS